MNDFQILEGDVRNLLPMLPDDHFQTCITSPPYYGLRDYGTGTWEGGDPECSHSVKLATSIAKGELSKGIDTKNHSHQYEDWKGGVCGRCGATKTDNQIGLEGTFQEWVEEMVLVFRELRRTLKDDGTLWLNMGDSYAGSWGSYQPTGAGGQRAKNTEHFDRRAWDDRKDSRPPASYKQPGLKPKDLIGQPWALAFALREDGWYLRSDIIWAKPNPMPESVTDRPTKSHEYLFLLSKSPSYYYDAAAIREKATESTMERLMQPTFESQTGGAKDFNNGGLGTPRHSTRRALENLKKRLGGREGPNSQMHLSHAAGREDSKKPDYQGKVTDILTRNKRTVWTHSTACNSDAHFAVMPEDLVKPCILAGSRPGDTVLDIFNGSGTTGKVALEYGRNYVGIELNPKYCEMAEKRLNALTPALPFL